MTDRKTCYVGLRLSTELYEAARARAASESLFSGVRVTVSDVLRIALREALRAHSPPGPPREPPQWSGSDD